MLAQFHGPPTFGPTGAAGELPARMPPLSHSHYSCILVSADKTSVVSADTFPPTLDAPSPKWFWAITCNIWLRLEYRPLDSAWFFNTTVWYFRPQNPFLDPQILDLDPEGFQLGWGPFLLNKGGPENTILWRTWSPMGLEGDLCEGIGLYGVQEAFGQARFPPNPPKKLFYMDFPHSRRLVGSPPRGLVACLLPLCGPLRWFVDLFSWLPAFSTKDCVVQKDFATVSHP